jgi:hypothetical protein
MKNSSGNFISPAPDSVSAALATAKIPDDFRFSMVNAPGDKAYPISGASWVLVYQKQERRRTARNSSIFEMGGHRWPETFARAGLCAVAGRSPAARIEFARTQLNDDFAPPPDNLWA